MPFWNRFTHCRAKEKISPEEENLAMRKPKWNKKGIESLNMEVKGPSVSVTVTIPGMIAYINVDCNRNNNVFGF
jgi:hypothetical protein